MRTSHLYLLTLMLELILVGCNQPGSGKFDKGSNINLQKDTLAAKISEKRYKGSTIETDSTLINFSDSVLTLIKNRKYVDLSKFIDPQLGLLISPYGKIDTTKNVKLSPAQLIQLDKKNKIMRWGVFEGTGKPIQLTINNYFKRFVYEVDFIKAEKKSINKIIGHDSSSSNIKLIYPDCDFVQYYFSGFNKEYEGMDWKSLVLVFKEEGKRLFLVAIVHDEWKI